MISFKIQTRNTFFICCEEVMLKSHHNHRKVCPNHMCEVGLEFLLHRPQRIQIITDRPNFIINWPLCWSSCMSTHPLPNWPYNAVMLMKFEELCSIGVRVNMKHHEETCVSLITGNFIWTDKPLSFSNC